MPANCTCGARQFKIHTHMHLDKMPERPHADSEVSDQRVALTAFCTGSWHRPRHSSVSEMWLTGFITVKTRNSLLPDKLSSCLRKQDLQEARALPLLSRKGTIALTWPSFPFPPNAVTEPVLSIGSNTHRARQCVPLWASRVCAAWRPDIREHEQRKGFPSATTYSLEIVFRQGESAPAYLCFSISALISSGEEERKAC